jgi:hypothetical protein
LSGCGGAHQGGARKTGIPAPVGRDAPVQVVDRRPERDDAVRVPEILVALPRPRGCDEALPTLLGGLAARQAERRRDLAPGRARLARPVDELELALVQAGPGRTDLRQLRQVLHAVNSMLTPPTYGDATGTPARPRSSCSRTR